LQLASAQMLTYACPIYACTVREYLN
jgi:hypothetical protein